ncbi:sugar ABC transporter substrate-binding protein [Mycolicibacter terrae]|uniref:ABC transporter n=2 Tax=Mycolicibacter TaxID=1073531 RepID=A0A1A2Y6Z7_MYCSD|nr:MULTISPECIES: sugar ABC transporter substrate-binding protein [Mycolicibacter]OBH20240.1 ABC transporter [Mycolicibacter sinensis]OBI33198.1 ABC transporter [Mycolicibacter sinensis]RRR48225.1 sugar ABC transporter substrate-binding protein [Mycolicibacter terrae]
MQRRTFLRGAGLVGAAAALAPVPAACSADDDALTFFFAANPEEADTRMGIVKAFERRHPGIRVRTVLAGGDPTQQISTFCAGGRCPDVLMAWEFNYAGLADRGVLADLNPLLDADREFAAALRAESIPALYETFGFSGGQYAFPEQWSGAFLFYNTRLFAEAGVPPPPGRWDQPWTFDEFLDTATALTRRAPNGRTTQWGFVDTWSPPYTAALFGMNNGTPWAVPRLNPTHLNFDDGDFLDGIQFYADLSNRHRVAPAASDTQAISTMGLFTAGQAAMALGGHWRYQTFAQAEGLDFDVAVLPTGPAAAAKGMAARSAIGSTGLAIAAASRRREQAWEFVKFAAGPAGQALIGESGLFVPVLRSAIAAPGFAAAHTGIGNLAVLTGGPAHAEGLPISPEWQKVHALMDRAIGPVLRGKLPAASLKTELSPQIDEVLATA